MSDAHTRHPLITAINTYVRMYIKRSFLLGRHRINRNDGNLENGELKSADEGVISGNFPADRSPSKEPLITG